MQKITFLLLLFTAGIFSQTIQMPNIPEDGVVYETKTLNSTFSIPPADSWDFSDFEPVDEYDITMLPIENTSVSSSEYPNTTHIKSFLSGDQTVVQYPGFTSSGYTYNGENSIIINNYDTPLTIMPYPFSVGDTHSDAVYEIEFTCSFCPPYMFRDHEISTQALDSGTVTMPDGSVYENVVLVQQVATFSDAQTGSAPCVTERTSHFWWAEDLGIPLIETYFQSTSGACDFPSAEFTRFYTGLGEFADCSFEVFMTEPGSWPSEITWEIQDAGGAVVMSGNADSTGVQFLQMSSGETYTLVMNDSYGDGWNGGEISVNGVIYTVENGSQATATIECNVDPNAISFAATGSVSDYSATFSFDITNFTVGQGDGFDGHIHYSLNGGDTVMVYSADPLTLTDLPVGTHTIVFSLVDANHQPLDPAVESSVTFTITGEGTGHPATVAPWSENFNQINDGSGWSLEIGQPGGWALMSTDGGLTDQGSDIWNAWSLNPGIAPGDSNVPGYEDAYTLYHDDDETNGAGNVDNWIITPVLDCTELSTPTLSFVEYQTYNDSWHVFHGVYYSEDYDGTNKETATWTELQTGPAPFNEPTTREFSIPATTTGIAWRYQGDYADNWFVDDVAVGDELSTTDAEILDMRIYPNPVDGNYVTIQSPIQGLKEIEVYTVTGRKVLQTVLTDDQLDVSSFNSGFYMVKVTINGQSKLSKLVVR